MIMNAFTCTGSYAILILYGIKRTENRSAWPVPREGRLQDACPYRCGGRGATALPGGDD